MNYIYSEIRQNYRVVNDFIDEQVERLDIKYENGDWSPLINLTDSELREKLKEYNETKNRVLYYP